MEELSDRPVLSVLKKARFKYHVVLLARDNDKGPVILSKIQPQRAPRAQRRR